MESIKNALGMGHNEENNTQSGREPVSGSTGAGTATQPYDNGNQQDDSRLGGSAAQHNTTTGSGLGGYGSSQSGSEPISGSRGAGTYSDSYDSGNRSDPRLGGSSAQTSSSTSGYSGGQSGGQSHATGNSRVPESIQRAAPEGLERALPNSIHDTSGSGRDSSSQGTSGYSGRDTSSSGIPSMNANTNNPSDYSGLNYVGGENSSDLPDRTRERDTTSGLGSSTSGLGSSTGMGSSTTGMGSSTSGYDQSSSSGLGGVGSALGGVGSGQHHGHGHTSDRSYENTGSKLERVPSEELHAISAGKYREASALTAASYGTGSGTETSTGTGTYLDYDAAGPGSKTMGTSSYGTGDDLVSSGTGLTDRDTRSSRTDSTPLMGSDDRSSHHHSGTDKILASGTGATGRVGNDATTMGTGSYDRDNDTTRRSHGLESGEHGIERNAEARNPNHHFGVIDGGERNPSRTDDQTLSQHQTGSSKHEAGSSQHQGGMAEKIKEKLHMGGHK